MADNGGYHHLQGEVVMAGRVSPIAPYGSLLKGAIPAKGKSKTKEIERAPDHLALIRQCPCLSCGAERCDAAHVRMSDGPTKQNATGKKPPDSYTVPLCHKCHMEQHRVGEKAFWQKLDIDPLAIARKLAKVSPDLERMRTICR